MPSTWRPDIEMGERVFFCKDLLRDWVKPGARERSGGPTSAVSSLATLLGGGEEMHILTLVANRVVKVLFEMNLVQFLL